MNTLESASRLLSFAYGAQRTIYEHPSDATLLIGIEHYPQISGEMEVYMETSNIFHTLFPENFVEVVSVGKTGDQKDYSVFRKVNTSHAEFGEKYKNGKRGFLDKISNIFVQDFREGFIHKASGQKEITYLEAAFDFDGDRANLVIDKANNLVYVDKISPELLKYIDYDKLKSSLDSEDYQRIVTKIADVLKAQERIDEIRRKLDDLPV